MNQIFSSLVLIPQHFRLCFPVFTSNYPARSCVEVARLPLNALVEIEAVSLTGDVKTVVE